MQRNIIKLVCCLFATLFQTSAVLGQKTSTEHLFDRHVTNQDENFELAFVFELVRHGARAPIEDRALDLFGVQEGFLTPSGMRQRYLLGRHSRDRYSTRFGLISSELVPGEIYVQSTNVNRTIQSGYSELLGLYPPSQSEALQLTPAQVTVLKQNKLPFNVRNADQINESLGANALPHNMAQVPITEFINKDINDDVQDKGCPYITTVRDSREFDESIWAPYTQMRDDIKEPLAKSLNLTVEYEDELDFHKFEVLTDTDVALNFEGQMQESDYFSRLQWLTTHEFQRVWLSQDWNDQARDLMMSRIMRKPMKLMQDKVNEMLGLEQENELAQKPKYVIYSAHDDQLVNGMIWLKQSLTAIHFIPYASTIFFELKYNQQCLDNAETASEDCFGVGIIFNGVAQSFEEQCPGGDGFSTATTGCTYTDFKQFMANIWYSGPHADDLNQACYVDYTG